MSLREQILAVALRAVRDACDEFADLLDERGAGRAADPAGGQCAAPCSGCGTEHCALLHALGLRGGAAAQPEDGPATRGRAWGPAFADEVKENDLIALTGEQLGRADLGLRALRVTKIRSRDADGLFGSRARVLTLLLQDEDSGEVLASAVSPDQGLRIAAAAPDTVPSQFGGGS